MRPTQPYFVLAAEEFLQEIYLEQGISHFYNIRTQGGRSVRVVPDGCIDLTFEYGGDGALLAAFASGTVLACQEIAWTGQEIFGVRFLPGFHPEGLNVRMKDLLGEKLPLSEVWKDGELLAAMDGATEFGGRIRLFLQEYAKHEAKKEEPFGKRALVQSAKEMVYGSDGKVKISQIQEKTGYTARYINRVFIEEMGFSPKTFCKIIQFQRALEFLNYGAPDKMTDAAVYLGYYDQSQFIKDFKRYAGITPKKYLNLMRRKDYVGKVRDQPRETEDPG